MLSLIPISDANPTRRRPYITIGLIIVNVIAFLQEPLSGGLDRYFFDNAPVPCQLVDECPSRIVFGPNFAVNLPERGFGSFIGAILFSTFLHANILHIAGNMLFLWVFGNNVEDFLGHGKYLAFYLIAGIAAAFAHVLFTLALAPAATCTPGDIQACVPSVGASGAVAGVMGAYLLLYPRARVNVLVPIFILFTIVQMSAWIVLGLWFLYQFLIGLRDLAGPSGVAWMAHVGGFLFGLIAIFILGGRPRRPRPAWLPEWRY